MRGKRREGIRDGARWDDVTILEDFHWLKFRKNLLRRSLWCKRRCRIRRISACPMWVSLTGRSSQVTSWISHMTC
jgi:hypothetical protein